MKNREKWYVLILRNLVYQTTEAERLNKWAWSGVGTFYETFKQLTFKNVWFCSCLAVHLSCGSWTKQLERKSLPSSLRHSGMAGEAPSPTFNMIAHWLSYSVQGGWRVKKQKNTRSAVVAILVFAQWRSQGPTFYWGGGEVLTEMYWTTPDKFCRRIFE